MAVEIKPDSTLMAKVVLLVLSIITLGLAASCYRWELSKDEYFLAASCLSMIFTVLLLIIVFLIDAGSIQVGQVTGKQIDTIGHGLAGILLLIGAIVFAVSVSDYWKYHVLKNNERAAACFFGFLTSFVHFGVAFLAVKK